MKSFTRMVAHRRSASARSRTVALLAATLGLWSVGCGGDDPSTPDECADYPQYDIRRASDESGAVQAEGIVPNSPLTPEEQRQLQQLAAKGCITLPGKAFSLKSAPTLGGTSKVE